MNKTWMNLRFAVSRRESLWWAYRIYSWNRIRRTTAAGKPSEAWETRTMKGLDAVIDGFPGSGNSYAARVFVATQGDGEREPRLAHHLHAPNQVMRAATLDIPALLVVRTPEDAVISMHRRWPWYPLRDCMRQYISFHEVLLPWRDRVVVADFPDTTRDIGGVLRRMNKRFGSDFRTELTEEDLDGLWVRGKQLAGSEEKAAAAAAEKKALRERLEKEIEPALRKRAAELHDLMLGSGNPEQQ